MSRDVRPAAEPPAAAIPAREQRSRAPVFVLGCPRSGTTLLYHMLLSAGGFVVYRTESSVFNVLAPCFGNLAVAGNRTRLMDAWTKSKLFARSGLDAREIDNKVMAQCRSAGDFLRIIMEEMARRQNVPRWADSTPEHLLYTEEIKRAFPSALIVHIIRDGRDVALSLEKQRWIRPIFSGSGAGLLAAGLYWEWMVGRGREAGRGLGRDYLEVRFEDLIQSPRETLGTIGLFIEQDLDYERIQEMAIGSVSAPNTSFETTSQEPEFAPVSRWRKVFPERELGKLEAMAGDTLRELGYLTSRNRSPSPSLAAMRQLYRASFSGKLWVKTHTALSPILMKPDLSWL